MGALFYEWEHRISLMHTLMNPAPTLVMVQDVVPSNSLYRDYLYFFKYYCIFIGSENALTSLYLGFCRLRSNLYYFYCWVKTLSGSSSFLFFVKFANYFKIEEMKFCNIFLSCFHWEPEAIFLIRTQTEKESKGDFQTIVTDLLRHIDFFNHKVVPQQAVYLIVSCIMLLNRFHSCVLTRSWLIYTLPSLN